MTRNKFDLLEVGDVVALHRGPFKLIRKGRVLRVANHVIVFVDDGGYRCLVRSADCERLELIAYHDAPSHVRKFRERSYVSKIRRKVPR